MPFEFKPPEPGGFYHLMPGETAEAMLIRIDERTKNTENDVREIKNKMENQLVTQEAFKSLQDKVAQLQKIVFSVIALMCITMMGAIFRLVIMPPSTGIN